MKQSNLTRKYIAMLVIIACLLTSPGMYWNHHQGLASSEVAASSDSSLPAGDLPKDSYLIPLPMPDTEVLQAELSRSALGVDRPGAERAARALSQQLAAPLLRQLQRLQAHGWISGFELRPELHAIAVQADQTQALESLPGADFIYRASAEAPPACVALAASALIEQVQGFSQAFLRHSNQPGPAATATNPSIFAHIFPDSQWSYVIGYTNNSVAVNFHLLRKGRLVASQSTTSNSSGLYSFYPSWRTCPDNTYSWQLLPGDIVEVIAAGNTVQTTLVPISGWVDPLSDTVAGSTSPGRAVEVSLYNFGASPCSFTTYTQSGPVDGNGMFNINFSGMVDINRRDYSNTLSKDINGNGTIVPLFAFQIYAYLDEYSFEGYIKPNTPYQASLIRGSSTIGTYNGTSWGDGYFNALFSEYVQPGDVLAVNGDGVAIEMISVPLDASLDYSEDKAYGTTAAGHLVAADFRLNSWDWFLSTHCNYSSECTYTTSDGSGDFKLLSSLDLLRGDVVYIDVYDAQGNVQIGRPLHAPAIIADLSYEEIKGYWGDGGFYLTVELKDSAHTVKWSSSSIWADEWDGSFTAYPSASMQPGDIIIVSDGVKTETTNILNLTAHLDATTGHLSGDSPGGQILAQLYDFRPNTHSTYSYCQAFTQIGTNYDTTFSGSSVGGQDYSYVWDTAPDAHYTYRFASAFTVNLQKDGDQVWGYLETPGDSMKATLFRGGIEQGYYEGYAYNDGFFAGTLPVVMQQGDELYVKSGDGDDVSLIIPALSVYPDSWINGVAGVSPANQPVRPEARRWSSQYGYYSMSRVVTSNASGNYSTSFDGYWWGNQTVGCFPFQADHPCLQFAAYYYYPAGHQVWQEEPKPSAAPADSYEVDDSAGAAVPFAGISSHTFHTSSDVDWVSFNVTAGDVSRGLTFYLETLNLGFGMDTYLHLYASDGTTELAADDDSGLGYASLIRWAPSSPGTYYVKVRPFSSSKANYCDAHYDLMIWRSRVYLPVEMRNY